MEHKFKVYFVEPFDTALHPLAITTVYSNPGGYRKAEWYLLVPGQQDGLSGQVVGFGKYDSDSTFIKIDEDFMFEEMSRQAIQRARIHVFDKYHSHGLRQPFNTPELILENNNSLTHYWMSGQCQAEFTTILHHTGCNALREFLERLTQLPHLTFEDI